MGRHAAPPPPGPAGPLPLRHGRDGGRPGPMTMWGRLLAAAVVVALAVVGGAWVIWQLRTGDGGSSAEAATDAGEGCEEVLVMVAAGAEAAVADTLAEVPAPEGGPCVNARVIDREPADALSDIGGGGAPDVWVADSSLWATRAGAEGIELETLGSFGSAPVGVVTGRAAAEALGWTAEAPSWSQVLATDRGVAVGALSREAAPLLALAAGMQDAGGTMDELAVSLALGQRRVNAASAEQGLQLVSGTDAQAPLVILGLADAARAGVGDDNASLVVVEPTGPVQPVLDYPVLAVPGEDDSAAHGAAVTAVAEALVAPAARTAAAASGLRPPVAEDDPVLRTFTPEELATFASAFEALATPVELLVVVDVSTSMLAPVPGAGSRAEVAAAALTNALGALPDESRVGLWYFANDVEGTQDYREVLPVERLDAASSAAPSHREAMEASMADLPRSLLPGGTSLYQVALDSVNAAKELRTEGYRTTVLFITDGQNEDSAGPTEEEAVAALRAENLVDDPAGTVGFAAVAFGTDADLEAVTALAAAGQGLGGLVQPVNATDAVSLEQLLISGLSARIPDSPGDGG
ncbi:MAG: VWA domain-containing protein [Kineosporiaceae bacterium]